MLILVNDVLVVIAAKLPFLSLISFLRTCKTLWNLRHRIAYFSYASGYYQAVKQRAWEFGMYKAIARHDFEMVQFFERKGALIWEFALTVAARQLPTDSTIMKYIEQRIESNSKWNWGMYGAAEAGNLELVQYFIGKGADNFNGGFQHAVRGGNLDLVKFFLSKMKEPKETNFLAAIKSSAANGHFAVLKFLTEVSKHENKYCCWWGAAGLNDKRILEYGRTHHKLCIQCMEIAVKHLPVGKSP